MSDFLGIINYIALIISIMIGCVYGYVLFMMLWRKKTREGIQHDWFCKWIYPLAVWMLFNFAFYRITLFISVGIKPDSTLTSLKTTCNKGPVLEKLVMIESITVSHLRLFTNLADIYNLLIFHAAVGTYFLIII